MKKYCSQGQKVTSKSKEGSNDSAYSASRRKLFSREHGRQGTDKWGSRQLIHLLEFDLGTVVCSAKKQLNKTQNLLKQSEFFLSFFFFSKLV